MNGKSLIAVDLTLHAARQGCVHHVIIPLLVCLQAMQQLPVLLMLPFHWKWQ